MSLREANSFVERFHRHNRPTVTHKFSLGLLHQGRLVGVAIAGRPVARMLDDGLTLEVNRVCVREGFPNGCSKLYARVKRIGQLFGYESIKTYTLKSESDSSLKAIGAVPEKDVPPGVWVRAGRPGKHQRAYEEWKTRWELQPRGREK